MVLLLLAGLWVGAGVYYWRSRSEGFSSDSIGSFHHQLQVLERTGPVTIDPANRLEVQAPTGESSDALVGTPVSRPLAATPLVVAGRRRRAFKRRRDVFFGLALGIFGSLLLGFIPTLRVMWFLTLTLTALLGTYTVVLINVRNRAAERSMNLSFRPSPQVSEASLLLRGPAN